MVYNLKDDAWSNLGLSRKSTKYIEDGARLIIVDDRLFFAHVCYYPFASKTLISIFEMEIEDRLFIPITKITCPKEMINIKGFPSKFMVIR